MKTAGMSSLTGQVGGDHYRNMGMQPFVLSLINGWDGAAHSIMKYIARHTTKNPEKGEEDLYKSSHICDIRLDLLPVNTNTKGPVSLYNGRYMVPLDPACVPQTCAAPIAMATFIESNKLTGPEAEALLYLERWVGIGNVSARVHANYCAGLKEIIAEIIDQRYNRKEPE